MAENINRRRFITETGAGVAATSLFTAESYARIVGANERIQMGIIGSGGRGRSVMGSFGKFADQVEFIHVCDVYEPNINAALKLSRAGAKTTMDYRELLNNKDVVAILNATPDHWHAGVLMDAVAAGKDAYSEKPFSYSIEQGAKMVKAVRATKQIVQVGMQRRSSEAVRGAKKLVDDGVLGEVVMARAQWFWNRKPMPQKMQLEGKLDWERFQGPAKKHYALDERRFFHWRNFSDYNGGHLTDQGTHLMDVIQWFCNDGKPPRSAVCQGAIYVHKGADVPDTFSAVYEYPTFLATWTLCYGNSYEDAWKIHLQGKKATMVIDDDGYRVFPEPWQRPNIPPKPTHEYSGGIPTEPHVKNFLDCVKSRQEPNAPVEVGHNAVTGPHLANMAMRQQKRVVLSDDGTTTAKL
ncbi:MAG TPA: Gfo/Idh/MocA family oxidoreductase [Blastocatellia bacterium]|nr:Gfo/Idh/MocA family oxidoreductase [Blastocatellia bacterium]HMX25917.1 Gfo/Idh/MocA family oxidoreductase [Blastocatellia bacterium]HMY74165.1 Gfo/Idh/MocA family oxidoreductase [Blastocatellia bacterium]HMZ16883.1 Gfo/Idh/MocA family oxidoreductase [Blastocatellia bacterium]HNG32124.1 Gfo/Idh/MocA family oxidoreductase [Blastocatellia bacterium]